MDVDCVDSTGTDETIRHFRRALPHAVGINSVGQMVRAVEERLGRTRLRRLRIFGHGGAGFQALGGGRQPRSWYNGIQPMGTSVTGAELLRRLTAKFERGGWAELHGCNVASGRGGQELLGRLAALWQVRVAGGTCTQTTAPGFEYNYAVASPDGRLVFKRGRVEDPPQNYDWIGLPLLVAAPIAGVGFLIVAGIRQLSE